MVGYRDIAADLRRRIQAGEYPSGSVLPTYEELASRYDVAYQTVRSAIAELTREGLVDPIRRRGTVVRARPAIQRLARRRLNRAERQRGAGTFTSDVQAAGATPRVEVQIRTEPADPRTAALLDIPDGDPVLVRERRMYADDQPIQLATSRLPKKLTDGTRIEQTDTGPGGTYARLEEAGHTLARFVETTTARLATPDEADALHIRTGAALLAITRTAYDTNGHAVETNDILIAAERCELIDEIPAD